MREGTPGHQLTTVHLLCLQEPADPTEMGDKAAGGVSKAPPAVPPSAGRPHADRRQTETGEGSVRRRACDSPYLEPPHGFAPEEEDDDQGESYTPRFSQHGSGSR